MQKIKMTTPLVEMDGDEMTRIQLLSTTNERVSSPRSRAARIADAAR